MLGGPTNLKERIYFELMFFCHNHLFNKIKFLPGFLVDTLATCNYFENAKHSYSMEVLACNLRVHPDLVGIKTPHAFYDFCCPFSPYMWMTFRHCDIRSRH